MPLKRKADVGICELDDELVIYNGETHEVHILDPVSAFLWELCDGQTTRRDMVAALLDAAPDATRETAITIVNRTLDRLMQLKLVCGPG